MTRILEQLVRVLWEIKKDLHVIASNMEANDKSGDTKQMTLEEYEKKTSKRYGH